MSLTDCSDLVRLTLVLSENQPEAPANHSDRPGQDLLKEIKEKQAVCNQLQQQLAASQHTVQEVETETHDLSHAWYAELASYCMQTCSWPS